MIHNGFTHKCEHCAQTADGCAACYVTGTNAYGEPETRLVPICPPCRRELRTRRRRFRIHPRHKVGAK